MPVYTLHVHVSLLSDQVFGDDTVVSEWPIFSFNLIIIRNINGTQQSVSCRIISPAVDIFCINVIVEYFEVYRYTRILVLAIAEGLAAGEVQSLHRSLFLRRQQTNENTGRLHCSRVCTGSDDDMSALLSLPIITTGITSLSASWCTTCCRPE